MLKRALITAALLLCVTSAPAQDILSTTTSAAGASTTAGNGVTIGVGCSGGLATTACLGDANLTYSATGLMNLTNAGTAGAPTLAIGNSTTGLYSVSTTGFCFADVNGTCQADYGIANSGEFTVNGHLFIRNNFRVQISGSGSFYQSTAAEPGLALASSGANWGNVANLSAHAYALGYTGTLASLGTAVLTWTDNGPVAIAPNNSVLNVTGATVSTTLLQTTTAYSAAGTALPTCNAGTKGSHAFVSDAISPTYLGAYASGGSSFAPVFCPGSAPWVTD